MFHGIHSVKELSLNHKAFFIIFILPIVTTVQNRAGISVMRLSEMCSRPATRVSTSTGIFLSTSYVELQSIQSHFTPPGFFVRLRAKHPDVLNDLQSRFDPYNTLSCDHELKHSGKEVLSKALSTKYFPKFCEHKNLEAFFFFSREDSLKTRAQRCQYHHLRLQFIAKKN